MKRLSAAVMKEFVATGTLKSYTMRHYPPVLFVVTGSLFLSLVGCASDSLTSSSEPPSTSQIKRRGKPRSLHQAWCKNRIFRPETHRRPRLSADRARDAELEVLSYLCE